MADLRPFQCRISGDFVQDIPAWIAPLIGVTAWDDIKSHASIYNLLWGKGWYIDSVADESGWTGDWIFRISGQVGPQYSDGQIASQLQQDLAGLFTVTGFNMLTQPYSVPGQYVVQGQPYNTGGPSPSTSTNPNYQTTGGAQPPGGGHSVWDDFFAGLGISMPVAVVIGAIALALMVKK